MGFKEAKRQLLECLANGSVLHQQRSDIDVKNLLAMGEISLFEVAGIIGRSRGDNYRSSPHHQIEAIEVHIIETRYCGKDWYIKWYFVEPHSVFISVHH